MKILKMSIENLPSPLYLEKLEAYPVRSRMGLKVFQSCFVWNREIQDLEKMLLLKTMMRTSL